MSFSYEHLLLCIRQEDVDAVQRMVGDDASGDVLTTADASGQTALLVSERERNECVQACKHGTTATSLTHPRPIIA